MLGDVAGIAHSITGHEKTQLNRVFYFHFLSIFLTSKGSCYSELIKVVLGQSVRLHATNMCHEKYLFVDLYDETCLITRVSVLTHF